MPRRRTLASITRREEAVLKDLIESFRKVIEGAAELVRLQNERHPPYSAPVTEMSTYLGDEPRKTRKRKAKP